MHFPAQRGGGSAIQAKGAAQPLSRFRRLEGGISRAGGLFHRHPAGAPSAADREGGLCAARRNGAGGPILARVETCGKNACGKKPSRARRWGGACGVGLYECQSPTWSRSFRKLIHGVYSNQAAKVVKHFAGGLLENVIGSGQDSKRFDSAKFDVGCCVARKRRRRTIVVFHAMSKRYRYCSPGHGRASAMQKARSIFKLQGTLGRRAVPWA